MDRLQSLLGFLVFAFAAWVFSEKRSSINWRTVSVGMILQVVLCLFLIKAPGAQWIFSLLNRGVFALEEATRAGTSFVLGYIGGGPVPFDIKDRASLFILAFQGLPLVLVISALSSLLFYWRVLPLVVLGFSKFLAVTMRLGGVEGVGTAANIFVGMVEAPLLVRPYLAALSRSELFTIMTAGMATIAGTVMVIYASILQAIIPDAIGHLLIASLISAPAAITVSKLMVPGEGAVSSVPMYVPRGAESSMDAITRGTLEGLRLLANICGMLVVLVALVHLINMALGIFPGPWNSPPTLQGLLGYLMMPVVWLMGLPWEESWTAGSLMGTKTVLNEFVAYLGLASLEPGQLSTRSALIMTYALSGFANFGSLGIMIGGMGGMVPERRVEIAALGMKSIIAGTIATCMTGSVVGMIA